MLVHIDCRHFLLHITNLHTKRNLHKAQCFQGMNTELLKVETGIYLLQFMLFVSSLATKQHNGVVFIHLV
jgi:hypothetical protein